MYQLGRAFTAVTMVEGTVNVARRHALEVIRLEQRLHIFLEPAIQQWFLQYPTLMHWTNRIYSFIHIPGTILSLVALYYYTTITSPQSSTPLPLPNKNPDIPTLTTPTTTIIPTPPAASPLLYAARRRTMAVCNLLAFIIFTLWPCMPPRLLSDPSVPGPVGDKSRAYGFIDTVHSTPGQSSVWTQNKFCNQYAAMPSLHFGYSLLIGCTLASVPLAPQHSRSRTVCLSKSIRFRVPSARRLACLLAGIAYPAIILVAIVATANHFLLDAVAGAGVCALAWMGNAVLLNLLPVEDWFLWVVRIHKPERRVVEFDGDEGWKGGVFE